MAFELYVAKDRKIAMQLMLHGVYRDCSDSVLRRNLRLTLACLLARHFEHKRTLANDLAMMDTMVDSGHVSFKDGVWVCSYVGFERVTSKWAKERGLHCVISARFAKGDIGNLFEKENHTVQFYF